jgi:hypothetical protein
MLHPYHAMENPKDAIIKKIEQKTGKKAEELFRQFVNGEYEDENEILAGIEFENWLADACKDSLKE